MSYLVTQTTDAHCHGTPLTHNSRTIQQNFNKFLHSRGALNAQKSKLLLQGAVMSCFQDQNASNLSKNDAMLLFRSDHCSRSIPSSPSLTLSERHSYIIYPIRCFSTSVGCYDHVHRVVLCCSAAATIGRYEALGLLSRTGSSYLWGRGPHMSSNADFQILSSQTQQRCPHGLYF
jgi:hypothetical protein